jgi:hypothetical protein
LIAETLTIEGTEAAWKSVCNPLVIGVRIEGRDRRRRLELPISEVNVLKDLFNYVLIFNKLFQNLRPHPPDDSTKAGKSVPFPVKGI